MGGLDWNEFPNLGYTANLKDWADFIRRTPDEYAKWIEDVAKECEILELRILEDLVKTTDKKDICRYEYLFRDSWKNY